MDGTQKYPVDNSANEPPRGLSGCVFGYPKITTTDPYSQRLLLYSCIHAPTALPYLFYETFLDQDRQLPLDRFFTTIFYY